MIMIEFISFAPKTPYFTIRSTIRELARKWLNEQGDNISIIAITETPMIYEYSDRSVVSASVEITIWYQKK